MESEPGEGSAFRVYLLRSAETPEEATATPVEVGPRPGSETVLLVEDDEMFLELLAEVLEGHGYTVLSAVMPGATGTELAKQLLDLNPEMKVILMSGYTDEAVESRSLFEVGGTFLQKPFSTKEFTHTIREVLDG